MAQKQYSSRQSELQPVYDLMEGLRPSNLARTYRTMDYHARSILMISIGSLVLLWSVLTVTRALMTHVRNTSGLFLMDALAAPYQMNFRLIPSLDQFAALPQTAGEFNLVAAPQQALAVPEGEQVAEAAAPTYTSAVESPLARCLFSAVVATLEQNCVQYSGVSSLAADYRLASGATVNLVGAAFASHGDATRVVRKMFRVADEQGGIGNYAIGIADVDYFYSVQNGLFSYTWSRGPYVYTVSGASAAEMDQLVEVLPF